MKRLLILTLLLEVSTFSVSAQSLSISESSLAAPAQNPFTTYNLNNIVFVDGVKYKTIQAAVNALPAISGKPAGTIFIPNAITIADGQEVVIGPYTQLRFLPNASITYTGSGTAFTCSDAPTTYGGDGGIYDLQLTGTSKGAVGIANNECTYFHIEHTYITGFTNGTAILFYNSQKWTEQSNWTDVHAQFNLKDYDFQDNCANHSGCPSFGYTRMYHVIAIPMDSNDGFQFENDANLGYAELDINCFLSQNSNCLHLKDTSGLEIIRLWIRGELTTGSGATSANGIVTESGTLFQPLGLMENWAGAIGDKYSGTRSAYIYNVPDVAFLQDNNNGLIIGTHRNSFLELIDTHNITASHTFATPDASGTASLAQVEDCGATSGATQSCAKTQKSLPITVFGNVTLNKAATQSIISLPFTNASSYACSGSDVTTASGIVSFINYAATSVTIQESGGANTDHLRYMCVGF